MSNDLKIPAKLQPVPTDYRFDLDQVLASVVTVKAKVPADAFTAGILGTERMGSGAVIADDGLVLTIGYLITEAETIWLLTDGGDAVPGHVLGVDMETGFGLVQPLGKLVLPKLELGNSDALGPGDDAVLAACGGRKNAVATQIVARQTFAGYWEYLLENAIFTAPAHPMWGGAALLDVTGRLVGVGSLIMQQADTGGRRLDRNMIVPTNLLPPILETMRRTGASGRAARPWLGCYIMENDDDELIIGGLADNSPAERAGLLPGDEVVALNDQPVMELATLWRRLWTAGPPGTRVSVTVRREGRLLGFICETIDRARLLRMPSLH